jgi:hypothetical protein
MSGTGIPACALLPKPVTYYERNLPHWHPEGTAIFLTWRLHGTLPGFSPSRSDEAPGAVFAAWDRELDRGRKGPRWLERPGIAQNVVGALVFGERHLKLYVLTAYCVMPNHVHLVIEPHEEVARITKSIKGYTARRANQILGRSGETLWQDESYDHWVRDRDERQRIIRYVERNPVKAGLVASIGQ